MNTPATCPVIEKLRERIRCLEGAAGRRRLVLPFGVKAIDRHLPGGGLALGALHEVAGGGNGAINGAAAALFAAGIAARTRGKVLWCITRSDLFAPALAQAGLVPDRVIYVEAGDEKSALICFEEGLRHGGLGAVIAEVARLSMTAPAAFNLLPNIPAPSVSPSAAGGGRQRRPISASRRHPSPAGASARSPQPHCRCLALDAPGGSSN
jgi:protein ImuA